MIQHFIHNPYAPVPLALVSLATGQATIGIVAGLVNILWIGYLFFSSRDKH